MFDGMDPPRTTMKKLIALFAAAVVLGLTAGESQAGGGSPPNSYGYGGHAAGYFLHKQPMPAFQAAPWYLYWPYDGHFLTPAPLTGPFYAPPTAGGTLTNPYFPQGGYGNVAPAYGR